MHYSKDGRVTLCGFNHEGFVHCTDRDLWARSRPERRCVECVEAMGGNRGRPRTRA